MMILKHKFTMYIPTVDRHKKPLSKKFILSMLKNTTDLMEVMFGGATAIKGTGAYDGISEVVYMITSFCTDAQHELHTDDMLCLARSIKRSADQTACALEIDNEMVLQ